MSVGGYRENSYDLQQMGAMRNHIMSRRQRIVVGQCLAVIGVWVVCGVVWGIGGVTAGGGQQVEAEYMAVFIEGKKAGYGVHVRRVEGGKVTTSEQMNIVIKRADVALGVSATETYVETVDGKPLGFESSQQFGAMAVRVVGRVNEQGSFDVTMTSGTMTNQHRMAWPDGALMAEGLRLLTKRQGLAEGTTFGAKAFVGSMMAAMDVDIRVGPTKEIDLLGRVVSLTEVMTSMKVKGDEITTISYVDDEFNPQKMIVPIMDLQIEMVACSREFALSENDVPEFLDKLVLASPVKLESLGSVQALRYRLRATKAGEKLEIPATDSQKVGGDGQGGLLVTVRPMRAAAGATMPYQGEDKNALAALKPTLFLQSDSEVIKKLAGEAVGSSKDAGEAAGRIEAFVHEYVKDKNLSVGYASAVEVAASRQGDCSEHAVLTAALCRAAGIPAQVAVGYVYCPEFGGRGSVFVGHAWTRAYVGGKWIGLDSTRGAGGYSAGHLMLAAGDGNPEDFLGWLI